MNLSHLSRLEATVPSATRMRTNRPTTAHRLSLAVALVAAAMAGNVHAQGHAPGQPAGKASEQQASSPVESVLTVKKVVVDEKGKERLEDAANAKPGDVLEYDIVYRNHSDKPVSRLVGSLPIPEGTEYVPNVSKPGSPAVEAALKDGRYAQVPLTRVDAKGATVNVPYAEYRSLRWNFGQLAARGSREVRARAMVSTVPEAKVASTANADAISGALR